METLKKMPANCDICCDKFTKQTRKPITCNNCDLIACACCIKQYILSKKEPHCMGCMVGWTDAHCAEILGGFMHGAYRKHTKELLWDMEKARMPETMPAVEVALKLRNMKKEEIEMQSRVDEMRKTYETLFNMHKQLKRNIDRGIVDGSSPEEMEQKKKQFNRACPGNDCPGFLSSQWKCCVCETWTCKDCMEVIGKDKEIEHTCDPDVLASAQLLKKETKPCPSCSCAIYKVSGCDQMWCTQCKVAFSWKTGLKIGGTIHNPHFYEWQRKNGGANRQNPGAIACGGLPGFGSFSMVMGRISFEDWKGNNYFKEFFDNHNTMACYTQNSDHRSNIHYLGYAYRFSLEARWKEISEIGIKILIERHPDAYGIIPPQALRRWLYTETEEMAFEIKKSVFAEHAQELGEFLEKKHRAAQHFQNVELERLRRNVNRHTEDNDNETDRVLYLLKELGEDKFKTNLIKNNRKQKKEKAILDIYEVFNNVMADSIRTIYERVRIMKGCQYKNGEALLVLKEQSFRMENVRKYCNIELLKISKTYSQVVPWIREDGYVVCNVRYNGVWQMRAESEGFDKIFDGPIEDLYYHLSPGMKIKTFKFETSVPKILQDGYVYPVCDKLLEDTYILYKKAFRIRRNRRN